jgi:hypothetical protein
MEMNVQKIASNSVNPGLLFRPPELTEENKIAIRMSSAIPARIHLKTGFIPRRASKPNAPHLEMRSNVRSSLEFQSGMERRTGAAVRLTDIVTLPCHDGSLMVFQQMQPEPPMARVALRRKPTPETAP